MFNQLMVLPNVIALVALSSTVALCAKTKGEKSDLPAFAQDDEAVKQD